MKEAVTVAKDKRRREEGEPLSVLSTGIKARLIPVAATLVQDVASRVKDPDVPMWHNPDKDREEPNPNDPKYLRDLADAGEKRGLAAVDAMVMFGVELEDGYPDPETDPWLRKLKFMERRGHISLDDFDLEDELDLEFVYKRYIAVSSIDLVAIGTMSGIQPEEAAAAARMFQGDAVGNAD
jgi:hypothetical protein